jgi:geranylgeranyl reductase family protein
MAGVSATRSTDLTTDVAVVGAGPAGAAAAITLARLGRRVILIDKATFPRDKCCGDGLTTAAVRRYEHLGLRPGSVASWQQVSEVVVADPEGVEVALPLPANGQFAASARRADLDAAFVEVAVRAGADLIQGQAVTGASSPPGGHEVALDLGDGRQVRARYAIGADGMWSPLRKLLGLSEPGYLGDWQAGRQYYTGVGPAARKLRVWFEPDMLPGYAWSFPLPDGAANVGYGVLRRPGRPLGELKGQRIDLTERPRIAQVLGPDAVPAGPWKAWPIPTGIGQGPLSGLGGRVLFVGDAARGCDPMTGEGIAQALESAEAAARAMVAAGAGHPALAAARYQRQVRWGMQLDDRLAQALSRVLTSPRGAVGCLRLVDASDWCRRNFVRWMFEDYPRAALATPHRWNRGMFHRPGAYVSA